MSMGVVARLHFVYCDLKFFWSCCNKAPCLFEKCSFFSKTESYIDWQNVNTNQCNLTCVFIISISSREFMFVWCPLPYGTATSSLLVLIGCCLNLVVRKLLVRAEKVAKVWLAFAQVHAVENDLKYIHIRS